MVDMEAFTSLISSLHLSVLPHSREEWEWLQTLAGMEDPIPSEQELETSQQLFLQELQRAIRELMQLVNIPLHEVDPRWEPRYGGRQKEILWIL